MKTKLTLTVDDRLIRHTKRLAQKRKTSVSALFEEWSAASTRDFERPPLGERLSGQWSEASGEDPRLAYLLEKHGG
jgi:hypothetical protein